MPTFESALLYPGLCLLEATNISEGRGTATPFRIAGAPWMRAMETAQQFNTTNNSVRARPFTFIPTEGKYANQRCNGVMLHVSDPSTFRPVITGWLLIKIIKDLHREEFAWAPYPTHVNPTGNRHLDLLLGIPQAAQLFENEWPVFHQTIQQHTNSSAWQQTIQPFLLYE